MKKYAKYENIHINAETTKKSRIYAIVLLKNKFIVFTFTFKFLN